MLNNAFRNRDKTVRVKAVQPGHHLSVFRKPELKLAFIPIVPRVFHADRRPDVHFADVKTGVPFERLNDDVPFSFQLLFISQMLELAAPHCS